MGVSVTDATHAAKDRTSSGIVSSSGKSTSIMQAFSHPRRRVSEVPCPAGRPTHSILQIRDSDQRHSEGQRCAGRSCSGREVVGGLHEQVIGDVGSAVVFEFDHVQGCARQLLREAPDHAER